MLYLWKDIANLIMILHITRVTYGVRAIAPEENCPPDNCPLDYCSRRLLLPGKLLLRIITLRKIDSAQKIVPWMIALMMITDRHTHPHTLFVRSAPHSGGILVRYSRVRIQ